MDTKYSDFDNLFSCILTFNYCNIVDDFTRHHLYHNLLGLSYWCIHLCTVHIQWKSLTQFSCMNTVWYYIQFCNYSILLPGVLWGLFLCLLGLSGTSHLFHTTPSPLVSYGHHAPSTAALAGTHACCGTWQLLKLRGTLPVSHERYYCLPYLRKCCNLRKYSVSPDRPLYMVTIAFSPPTVTSDFGTVWVTEYISQLMKHLIGVHQPQSISLSLSIYMGCGVTPKDCMCK